MSVVRRARGLGAHIEIADFGAWSGLYAEYDGRAGVIRVSARHLRALRGARRRRFFVRAVAHELYHHLERLGRVPRLRSRAQREAAAERFARSAIA
jgi:hypothetical protein